MPAGLADRVAAEMNFQGPASDWPPCNASFSGMVDEFGPRVQSAREQPFISPWAGKTNVLLRVDHRFRGKGG
jgi:hypothetical protein